MENQYLSTEYRRSRIAYVTQCTLEHLIGLLVADAFLAKLLSHLGLNDALIGVISSFTSIAFVFQLIAIYIAKSKLSTKKAVIILDGLSQLFFMLLYLIPFFPVSAEIKKFLVILSVIIGYLGKYVILEKVYLLNVPRIRKAHYQLNITTVKTLYSFRLILTHQLEVRSIRRNFNRRTKINNRNIIL